MSYGGSFQRKFYYRAPYLCKNLISSCYGWLQSRQRHGKIYDRYLYFLTTSQRYSNLVLEDLQFQSVKDFLVHSMEHSRFYRRLFHEYAFTPQTMQSLTDLTVLPILDKETIRHHLQEITPDSLKVYRPRWAHTSGTTGMGLRFPISHECFQREYAFRYLHYLWGDVRRGDKLAFCFGHPVAEPDRQKPPFWVYDYHNNWLLLSSYHMAESTLPLYLQKLENFQPDLISGYPSSLYLLALANQRLGYRIYPRAIYTASETIFDFQRAAIEKSFNCKLFMWYGNTEMCANIVECEKGRYHMKLEHSYVELLDPYDKPVPPGSEGRLVCTAFGNYAMPLVRYNIGDIAIPSEVETCNCGRGGKLVERVVGRVEDYILTPDGRYVGRLDHLFKDAVNVKFAQVIQNKIDEVIIRVIKEQNYTQKDENEIYKESRLRLGSKINIVFEYVNEVERLSNGKFRFIVSNIHCNGEYAKRLA